MTTELFFFVAKCVCVSACMYVRVCVCACVHSLSVGDVRALKQKPSLGFFSGRRLYAAERTEKGESISGLSVL